MTRCPRECNVAERRQKGIKKRRQGVGDERNAKLWTVTIEEEIGVEVPNMVEPITITKND